MKLTTFTLALIAEAGCSALKAKPGHSPARRPNILFIIADDQSPYDLKVYDSESPLDTPVLDRLAAEGMVLDEAHHMGALAEQSLGGHEMGGRVSLDGRRPAWRWASHGRVRFGQIVNIRSIAMSNHDS